MKPVWKTQPSGKGPANRGEGPILKVINGKRPQNPFQGMSTESDEKPNLALIEGGQKSNSVKKNGNSKDLGERTKVVKKTTVWGKALKCLTFLKKALKTIAEILKRLRK